MNTHDKNKLGMLISKAIEEIAFFRMTESRDTNKLLDVSYYLTVAQQLIDQKEYELKAEEDNEYMSINERQEQGRQWAIDFLNDARLNKSRKMIEKNLLIHFERSTYDHSLAQKLWLYWVEEGVKEWNNGSLKGFDLPLRRAIARSVAEDFIKRYELGQLKDGAEE
jgi:hypothetical protein